MIEKITADQFEGDEFTKKRIEVGLAKNEKIGGSIEIEYNGYSIFAPLRDIFLSMQRLQEYDDKTRERVMKSVNRSIANNFGKTIRQEVDTKRAVEIMQDIAIWYANEVRLGRKQLP